MNLGYSSLFLCGLLCSSEKRPVLLRSGQEEGIKGSLENGKKVIHHLPRKWTSSCMKFQGFPEPSPLPPNPLIKFQIKNSPHNLRPERILGPDEGKRRCHMKSLGGIVWRARGRDSLVSNKRPSCSLAELTHWYGEGPGIRICDFRMETAHSRPSLLPPQGSTREQGLGLAW